MAIVAELTGGLGADVAIEAVGVPATFELAVRLARPGGHVANIGVHGEPATLHLEELWIRDVTITTGLVDTYSTPTLLRLVTSQQLDAGRFVTHHFTLDQFERGLRRVRPGRGDRRPQGRPHPGLIADGATGRSAALAAYSVDGGPAKSRSETVEGGAAPNVAQPSRRRHVRSRSARRSRPCRRRSQPPRSSNAHCRASCRRTSSTRFLRSSHPPAAPAISSPTHEKQRFRGDAACPAPSLHQHVRPAVFADGPPEK